MSPPPTWLERVRHPPCDLGPPRGEDVRRPGPWLAAVTLLAILLRSHQLGSDLWLDEITTVLDSRATGWWEIATTFKIAGRHVLNSLLVKAMVEIAGPSEWSVRLPAAVLGVAGVPAIYLLARPVFRRREALLVALLLATSYHAVFFSQNARGYTGHLLGAMLSTAFFLRALAGGKARDWLLHGVSTVFATAAMLLSLFVFAGHVATLAAVVGLRVRRRQPVAALLKTAAATWGLTGLALGLLLARILPALAGYVGPTYRSEGLGFAPFSRAHLQEWLSGLAAGFGGVPAAVAAVALLGVGWLVFSRRYPIYSLALCSPVALLAAYHLAAGLRVSPRFFLWGLPVALLFLVGTPSVLGDRFGGKAARWLPVGLVGLTVIGSLASLPAYYRAPKQPNRRSLEWVLERRADNEPIAGAYLAKWGLRFYGPRHGLAEGDGFHVVHEVAELTALEAEGNVWLLTTFRPALAAEHPRLARYVEDHYHRVRKFPATVRGADVQVWRRRGADTDPRPDESSEPSEIPP